MIATWLYRNPRILLLITAVIVVSGGSSFLVMPRLEDPVLGRRVALVSTVFPGANAERVETLVTIPLEESLTGVSKIKRVRSNSQAGISNLVIELVDQVDDIDAVWSLVRNRIADVAADLPETTFPPNLKIVPLKAYAAIIAVQSASDRGEPKVGVVRRRVRRLRALLTEIPGTERVDVFGDPGEEYMVEIEPTRLAETELSTVTIAEQIIGNSTDRPAGRLVQPGGDLSLEIQSAATASEQIGDTLIAFGSDGQTKRLSEIARINRQLTASQANMAIIDDRPAIVLGAMVSDELRVDQWADRMEQTLAAFASESAGEVTTSVLFSQRQHVDERMRLLLRNLGIGTLAVMIVVLFMMGWRSMLVVAAALPLSACLVLSAMRALGIPIHQMSVTGLIVALGLLIDNAIVIVEEIRSRVISGVKALAAITDAVRHLAMPLFGSTLTTALAFLPIAILPGPPGEFVGTIAVSVILAISASFLLAMTLIPALISLLKIDPAQKGLWSHGASLAPLRKLYEGSLRVIFRIPLIVVIPAIFLPVCGSFVAERLPEQFFPTSDRNQIQIEVELAARDSASETLQAVDQIRRIVGEVDRVDRQSWFLGGSAPTFYYNVVPRRRGTAFYAQAFLDLSGRSHNGDLVRSLQAEIDSRVPQARVVVRQLEQGPPFDAPIEVRIFGPDPATLQDFGSRVRLLLSQTANVIHTRSDFEETIPRLTFDVDAAAAGLVGLDKSQLAGLLYTTLEGASAGSVYDEDEELPVHVRLALDGKVMLERLAALPLPEAPPQPNETLSGSGLIAESAPGLSPLTLASLTTHELNSDVASIVRINGRRANEVKAYLQAEVLPSTVISEFRQRLADSGLTLPDGYSLEFGGETEQRSQAVDRLIANASVLFALMLLTLVASFGSFRCALIIAAVGGLSASLGPLALGLFGFPLGFMAIVGTMGLVGVAINDSIVVLAGIRDRSDEIRRDREELVRVVSGCTRHIISTSLTTIVGFLPLILGGGGFWPPLAVTIAGGVAGATFLALYFTPSLYLLFFGRRAPAGKAVRTGESESTAPVR